MRVKAVLFDKDGTLLSFQKTWGPWVGHVISQLSVGDAKLAADMARAWAFDADRLVIKSESVVISGTVAEVAGAILPLVEGYDLKRLIQFLDETGAKAPAAEEIPLVEFLDGLADMGLAVGIATNDSESTARAQLAALGIEARFGFIAGYDSGHGGKPDPGMCLAFARHLGLEPGDIAMVGDSAHDMDAGRRAGMQTVAVLSGVAERAELAPLADVILPDIGHLADWLKQS